MTEAYDLDSTTNDDQLAPKLEALLEAARRANWDALRGPMHLRSGRYRPGRVARQPIENEPDLRLNVAAEDLIGATGPMAGLPDQTPFRPEAPTLHTRMRYRLDELAEIAGEFEWPTRRVDEHRLDVLLPGDCRLAFCNLVDDEDTLVGFDGTPWHAHGIVQFCIGGASYIDCDELDILIGLGSGELVVISEFLHGELRDRWIRHRLEPLDLEQMEVGEELRVRCLAPSGPAEAAVELL